MDLSSTRSLDVLLEHVQQVRAQQLQHFDALDAKAGILLGFAGALIAERAYHEPYAGRSREGGGGVMPERMGVREEDAIDEERRQRRLQNPEVQKRLQEIRESIARGEKGPGVTAEELPEFLREQPR